MSPPDGQLHNNNSNDNNYHHHHRSHHRPSHTRRSREQSPDPHRSLGGRHDHIDSRHDSLRSSYPVSGPRTRPLTPQPYPSSSSSSRPAKRLSWPPFPACEDEKVALAKEANATRLADSDKSEARSRGVLDQQPIILEAEIPVTRNGRPDLNYAQSTGEPARASKVGAARPPFASDKQTKDGKSERRGTATPPSFDDSFPQTPELGTRQSTPYVFTPKASDSSKTSSADSGYFSSPEAAKVTAAAEKRKVAYGLDENAKSDALRGKGKHRDSSGRTRDGTFTAPCRRGFCQ